MTFFTFEVAWSSEDICEVARQSYKTEYLDKFEQLLKKESDIDRVDCNLFELAYSNFERRSFVADIRPERLDNLILLIRSGYDLNWVNVNGDTPLHRAAYKNDPNLVYYLIKSGADINALDNIRQTPLEVAVRYRNNSTANVLLHLHQEQKTIDNALEEAIKDSEVELVEILLQHGANPSFKILEKAKEDVEKGLLEHQKILSLLKKYRELRIKAILQGKNPRQIKFNPPPLQLQLLPPKQDPPLIKAIRRKDLNAVIGLISQGANPNTISKSASTALNIAIGSEHQEIAKILIEAGANLTLQNSQGYYPLYLATNINSIELICLLINNGAPVNQESAFDRSTALNLSNSVEISKLLLDKGADINHQSKLGNTPLFNAVENKNLLLVELLLDRGADVSLAYRNKKETPFLLAVRSNQPEMVKLLLNYVNESEKVVAYDRALLNSNREIINIFEQAAVRIANKEELFNKAVQSKNLELIQQLLTPEIKDYLKSDRGSLNLLNLINNGGDVLEVLKVLIDNGVNVNVFKLVNDETIKTPLLSAINSSMLHNPVDAIGLLIDNGAEINVYYNNNKTPLSVAINRIDLALSFEGEEPPEEVELELEREEYIKYRNEYYAQQYNEELKRLTNENLAIIELLLEAGANIEEKNTRFSLDDLVSRLKADENKILADYGKKIDLLFQQYQ